MRFATLCVAASLLTACASPPPTIEARVETPPLDANLRDCPAPAEPPEAPPTYERLLLGLYPEALLSARACRDTLRCVVATVGRAADAPEICAGLRR